MENDLWSTTTRHKMNMPLDKMNFHWLDYNIEWCVNTRKNGD